jgi:soluble cytochrome b562
LLPAAGLLALGVCFLAVARGRDDDDEKAAAAASPDVQKLADSVGNAAALKKQADMMEKKYELKPIMWAFKPKAKGGLTPGGIELELIGLGKKPLKTLPAQAADLQKMTQVIRGIAEVAPSYAGKFTKTPAETKTWDGLVEDMKKGSDELSAAIKANDPKAVQKAANDLNTSCNDCHTKFRDN